jgi:hypothetical protein
MSDLVATLTVGPRLRHDGETFQVVDFAGRRITLQSAGGRERQVEIGWLLGHPSTELLGADRGQAPLPAVGPEFAVLTEHEHAALAERAAHVREVLSGYRSGSADLADPDEPRPGYDPAMSRMARYQAKAAELGVDERTVRRWVKAYQQDGAAGLLDGREARQSYPLTGLDPRWLWRPSPRQRPRGTGRRRLPAAHRHPLAAAAYSPAGLRQPGYLLAAAARLTARWRLAATPPPAVGGAGPSGPAGLVAGEPGLDQRAGQAGAA